MRSTECRSSFAPVLCCALIDICRLTVVYVLNDRKGDERGTTLIFELFHLGFIPGTAINCCVAASQTRCCVTRCVVLFTQLRKIYETHMRRKGEQSRIVKDINTTCKVSTRYSYLPTCCSYLYRL